MQACVHRASAHSAVQKAFVFCGHSLLPPSAALKNEEQKEQGCYGALNSLWMIPNGLPCRMWPPLSYHHSRHYKHRRG